MALTQVKTGGINADSVTAAKIADDAVGAEHIEQLDADLSFADSTKAKFGAGNDLEVFHDATHSRIHNNTGILLLEGDGNIEINAGTSTANMARFVNGGAVELYHNNVKKLDTRSDGIAVWGAEGGDAQLRLVADEGDDGADYWRLESNASTNNFNLATYASGSWVDKLSMNTDGNLGVGTNTPTASSSGYNGATLHLHQTGSSSAGSQVKFTTGASGAAAGDGTLLAQWSDNNFYINNQESGNIQFYTGGSSRARLDSDGLKFGSDSAAANALDDYEEGTWTPVMKKFLNSTWVDATMTDNGTVQQAHYTKVGNTVQIYLFWNGWQQSDANYCAIGGLPFTSNGGGIITVGYNDCFTNNQNQGGLIGHTSTNISFYYNSNAWNGWSSSSARTLYLGGTYFTS